MTAAGSPVAQQVLVIPILRRIWLQHVCSGAAARGPAPAAWRTGQTLGEKVQLLVAQGQHWAASKVDEQWHKVQTAKEGTLNGYLFKLAQFVLQRVNPDESFLKALPSASSGTQLDFHLPTSVPARLARRRLRLLCRHREPFHQKRMWLWLLVIPPQAPLAVLPLPNIPIYYSVWRVWSHRSAAAGARALMGALDAASDAQRAALAAQIRALQATGLVLRPGEWPAALVAEYPGSTGDSDGRQQQQVQGQGQQQQHNQQQQQQQQQKQQQHNQQQEEKHPAAPRLPPPVFVADGFLEAAVDPAARAAAPLSEAAVRALVEHYQQDHLWEHYRAAERTCLKQRPSQ